IAAILNLMVAFAGWFLSRYTPGDTTSVPAKVIKKPSTSETTKATRLKFSLLVVALFASGLISIGYELLWMRSIIHLLGGFTYVFSAVLTIYLLGNVIGAAISSRLLKKWNIAATGFAVTLCFLGICGIYYLHVLIFWMSKVAVNFEETFAGILNMSDSLSITIRPLIHCFPLFILPSIIMGMGFPMALQAWANHVHKVGRSTGTAYGANTIGAVAGGVITGFVLIPILGVQISFIVLGLTGIWIAAALFLCFYNGSGVVRKLIIPIVAIALTVMALTVPQDLFKSVVKINPDFPDWWILRDVREGVTTTVSVHYSPADSSLQLHSSGQSIAGDSFAERGDQKLLGHLAVLLNRHAKKALSVGFGSGETTYCLAQHQLERVDCVEIAPEVVEVALKHFTHINLGKKLNDEVNMIYMDAKNYIHLTDSKYDVIINDSIHPRDFAENASLYSKQYFQNAADKLNDGIIMSWIPTYNMPASVFISIIGTMMEVFPHVTMWHPVLQPAPLVLVVGSQKPQSFSPEYIDRQLQKASVKKSLAEIGITDSIDVLSCYVGDQDDLKKTIGQFNINSDYTPFVEFTTDPIIQPEEIYSRFILKALGDSIYQYIDWTNIDNEKKEKWIQRYTPTREVSRYLLMALATNNKMDALRYSAKGLKIIPGHKGLLSTRENTGQYLYSNIINLTKDGKIFEAQEQAKLMLTLAPDSSWSWIARVGIMVAGGNLSAALNSARLGVAADPNNFEAHFNLGVVLFRMRRYNEAAAVCPDMINAAKKSKYIDLVKLTQMMDMVAVVYSAAGKLEQAVDAAKKALEYAESIGQTDRIEHAKERLKALETARDKKPL
ncbi:MAG: fused MFS/spermidine synthase, partial [Planctomycetota bacterium]